MITETMHMQWKMRRSLILDQAAAEKAAIDRKAEEQKREIDRKAAEQKRNIDRLTDEKILKLVEEQDAAYEAQRKESNDRRKQILAEWEQIKALASEYGKEASHE